MTSLKEEKASVCPIQKKGHTGDLFCLLTLGEKKLLLPYPVFSAAAPRRAKNLFFFRSVLCLVCSTAEKGRACKSGSAGISLSFEMDFTNPHIFLKQKNTFTFSYIYLNFLREKMFYKNQYFLWRIPPFPASPSQIERTEESLVGWLVGDPFLTSSLFIRIALSDPLREL